MMYPGDPNASPKNVCQCRCTELPYSPAWEGIEPEPEPIPDFSDDLLQNITDVRSLGGSTGAMLVKDERTGQMYVMKRGADAGLLMEEAYANAAYQALGVNVPKFRVYQTPQGPVQMMSYVQDARPLSEIMAAGDSREIKRVMRALRKDFAADALLGNWDVIGLGYDNILVDSDGKLWRVDNGGALRYRAQGRQKADFGGYPTELWTMRNRKYNEQSARAFGDLGWFDVMTQMRRVNRNRKALLEAMPPELRGVMERRLDTMRDITKRSGAMKKDSWNEAYIDGMMMHTVGLRKSGVSGLFPDKLTHRGVRIYAGGREWDDLRGRSSVIKELAQYMQDNGGDYDIVSYWMNRQAGSSWSGASQALKYRIAESRGGDFDKYYWRDGVPSARSHYESAVSKLGKEKYDGTFQMWHAFNTEFLISQRKETCFLYGQRAHQRIPF